MADLARVYPSLLRVALLKAIAFRGQVVLWLLTSLFPLIMLAAWLSVEREVGAIAGFGSAEFVSYYVAATVVNHFTVVRATWDWDNDIRTGDLSVKLLKPLDPFHTHLTDHVGIMALRAALLLPVIGVLALVLPALRYPIAPGVWLLVAAAVVIGFVLNLVMASAFAMLAFWSTQVSNVYQIWWGIGFFLSGWIAPLDLFPAWFRTVARVLPFRSSLAFPVELALGRLDALAVVEGFGVALAWTAVFGAAYRVLWHRGLRRYEAVGS